MKILVNCWGIILFISFNLHIFVDISMKKKYFFIVVLQKKDARKALFF